MHSCRGTNKRRPIWAVVFLFLAILFLSVRVFFLYQDFHYIVRARAFAQERFGIPYTVFKNNGLGYRMIIGDILGVNPVSYEYVKNLRNLPLKGQWVIVPGLTKEGKITEANFLDRISTAAGVILADNFCTRDWESVKKKEIYLRTKLSPGAFCESEAQAGFIGTLIKSTDPRQVILPYDVGLYKDYIGNFLRYLKEAGIRYTLVQIDELKKTGL